MRASVLPCVPVRMTIHAIARRTCPLRMGGSSEMTTSVWGVLCLGRMKMRWMEV